MNQLDTLLRLLALDRLPRTGWILAGVPEAESVAAHSLGTALVALALGPHVEPALDVDRTVALATVHDAPEAVLGDFPREATRLVGREHKEAAEARAAELLLPGLSGLAFERYREHAEGATREARFARLCDKLQLGVRLLGYRRAGLGGPGGGNLGEFQEGLAELDASEFGPCAELQAALLAALSEL